MYNDVQPVVILSGWFLYGSILKIGENPTVALLVKRYNGWNGEREKEKNREWVCWCGCAYVRACVRACVETLNTTKNSRMSHRFWVGRTTSLVGTYMDTARNPVINTISLPNSVHS